MKQKEGKEKFCLLLMPELRRLQFSIGNRVSVVLDFPPPPPQKKNWGYFGSFWPSSDSDSFKPD